ncbi:MAG: ROK family protein [Caldilineaceae bacterium]
MELRQQNTFALLSTIQKERAIAQAGLARQTGLSPASVSSILQPFLAQDLLIENGRSSQQGAGRRGALLGFNDRKAVTAGVVVEQLQYEVGILGLSGNVIAHRRQHNADYRDPVKTSELITSTLHNLLQEHTLPATTLVGIGVAMPGMIDPEAGVVKAAANLGWRDVPFRTLLQSRLQPPVTLEHLGRAKAIAETLWGSGVGCANLVCVEIGSGIGAGILVDGNLLKGDSGAASEIGHVALDLHGPKCTCGLHGCWESYCSGPAIRLRIGSYLAAMPQIRTNLTHAATLPELEQAVQGGDPLAQIILAETANYMARGLLNVIWSFDPSLIILSGFVVEECPSLIEFSRVALRTLQTVRTVDVPLLATAQGADAGVIAASILAAVPFLEHLAFT